jgi:hypothetical protein
LGHTSIEEDGLLFIEYIYNQFRGVDRGMTGINKGEIGQEIVHRGPQ